MDFFYKKTKMPNVNCMKLSSYHKQKGDKINFIIEESYLNLAYDIIYISRELDDTPMPTRKLIDDKRTNLIGAGFKYYKPKQLSPIVMSCRPDYLLYKTEDKDAYANANYITFYAGNKLLTNQQDWHNTKAYHKKNLITDKNFWKADDKDICWCLNKLKDEKNIAFLEPISLLKILSNEEVRQKFLELHFSTGTIFKWKNDYSSDYDKVNNIIDFLEALRQKTKSNLGFVPIKSVQLDHYADKINYDLDLYRCFAIVREFKLHKLNCRIIAPKNNLQTPYYDTFHSLEYWTQYFPKLSYIEYVLHNQCLEQGINWCDVINNTVKWERKQVDLLLYLLTDDKWNNIKLFTVQWGYAELNVKDIDFQKIKEQISLLYKGDNNE